MYFMLDDQKHEDVVKARGGIGTLDLRNVIPAELTFGSGLKLGVMSFEPGYSIGNHAHIENCEAYYILEGIAKVTDDDEERILHPGDSELCGGGHSHSITNVGDGTLRILTCIFNNFEGK